MRIENESSVMAGALVRVVVDVVVVVNLVVLVAVYSQRAETNVQP